MRQILTGIVFGATLGALGTHALAAWAGDPVAETASSQIAPAAAESDTACSKPVLLVVWIDDLDRTKSKAYGEALRRTQIVKRHGGSYRAVSPPTLLLEGEWPANRGFVIERYPCLDALKKFWYSAEYQTEIKPLREGSGHYVVAAFEERP